MLPFVMENYCMFLAAPFSKARPSTSVIYLADIRSTWSRLFQHVSTNLHRSCQPLQLCTKLAPGLIYSTHVHLPNPKTHNHTLSPVAEPHTQVVLLDHGIQRHVCHRRRFASRCGTLPRAGATPGPSQLRLKAEGGRSGPNRKK